MLMIVSMKESWSMKDFAQWERCETGRKLASLAIDSSSSLIHLKKEIYNKVSNFLRLLNFKILIMYD
jgi:hypothetical protein